MSRPSRYISSSMERDRVDYADYVDEIRRVGIFTMIAQIKELHGENAASKFYKQHCNKYDPALGPLKHAVKYSRHKLVDLIIQSGNVKNEMRDFGDPLYLCCSYKMAKTLIKHGADPRNYVSDVGEGLGSTLLHHLTIFGREGAMRAVLESSNTAVNIPDSFGKTAIFYASSPGIVDLLFNAGFSVEWDDLEGFRPIHGMIVRGDTVPTMKALLERGCDPNAASKTGKTPLHIMCIQGIRDAHLRRDLDVRRDVLQARLDIMKLLADYGASFKAVDHEGKTPLDLLWIPPSEEEFEEWKAIKDYLMEMLDSHSNNHRFKRTRIFVGEAEIPDGH